MDVEKLIDAITVIEQVADNFGSMPEDKKGSVTAALHCRMCGLYLVELAKHLQDGMDPYDAYIAAALGDMELPETAQTVANLLRPENGE